jgi:hypothetical protein
MLITTAAQELLPLLAFALQFWLGGGSRSGGDRVTTLATDAPESA